MKDAAVKTLSIVPIVVGVVGAAAAVVVGGGHCVVAAADEQRRVGEAKRAQDRPAVDPLVRAGDDGLGSWFAIVSMSDTVDARITRSAGD